jgi:zinc protease
MAKTWLLTGTSMLLAVGLAAAAPAQTGVGGAAAAQPPATAAQAGPAAIPAATSWEHQGSDIPADPAWTTGTLPNGLRYAVRKDSLPVGQIAIRLRIGVGALMETPDQKGWSHLIEHMMFRGTKDYPDGDAIKIWQRLGASFGKDTNAQTTFTSTTLKLDLPKSDQGSYAQALDIMAGMVRNATFDPQLLATEKQVVIAEQKMRVPPLMQKVQDAGNEVFLTGLTAAKRDIGGTPATVDAASSAALKAYYETWYRPDNATLVVVGDADPAMLVAGIKRAFTDWHGTGPDPATPDFGHLTTPGTPAAIVTDPHAPEAITLAWMHPHDNGPMTIARLQDQFIHDIASAIIASRLSTAAQQGQAIINAGAGYLRRRDIADQLIVSVQPKPGQWQAALDQTFGVLNRLRATPPAQAEVDEQIANIEEMERKSVDLRETETSSKLADEYMNDVDTGDVTPTRTFYLKAFEALKPAITPAAVAKSIAEQLAPDPRMLLLSPQPIAGGVPAAVAALTAARKTAAASNEALRKVSLDELKTPDTPGKITAASTIDDLGIHRVHFANGVELDYKQTDFEKGTIRIQVQIGHGLLNRAPNDPGLLWTSGALTAAGIGPFSPDELNRLVAGRQIGFAIQPLEDGLAMATRTNRDDVADALKLMVGGLTQLDYAQTPIDRLKNSFAASYQAVFASPGGVLQAFGAPYFHGGDTRFRQMPTPDEVKALTLPAFRSFWQNELAQGPIKIVAVGDLDPAQLTAAVARTFGALPPRPDDKPTAADLDVSAAWTGQTPIVLHHNGGADQAAVAMVYPTNGELADVPQSFALDVAAEIIRDRLTDDFREKQGGTYTPLVTSYQSTELPRFGDFLAGAQLDVDKIAPFYTTLNGIVADLAAHGPDADALDRAVKTEQAAVDRQTTDNGYWLGAMRGDLDDPRYLAAVRTAPTGYGKVDAAAVQAAVRAYLAHPKGAFRIEVLPQAKAAQ